MMMGAEPPRSALERIKLEADSPTFGNRRAHGRGRHRAFPVAGGISLAVRAGEIVGIAGVSGNGQDELVEVLAGQRPPTGGSLRVSGKPYRPTRSPMPGAPGAASARGAAPQRLCAER